MVNPAVNFTIEKVGIIFNPANGIESNRILTSAYNHSVIRLSAVKKERFLHHKLVTKSYLRNNRIMQHQTIPAHLIDDVPMEDAIAVAVAAEPGVFDASVSMHDIRADVAEGFIHMTAGPDSSPPGAKQRLVRNVSMPTSESSSSRRPTLRSNDDLAAQLAAALAFNAQLQSELDIQSAHARSLEEKVVSQGQMVSALCVEVDRLSKDTEELSERLAMQMEQRRIVTDQFRQHLAMFKTTKNGHIKPQPNNFVVQPPRMSMPGSPCPPSKMAAVAPPTAASRRMSTGAAASCA